MKHLLARDSREVLVKLTASRVLLAFDFDGTLAPIVARRDEARMRALTSQLFAKVCRLYPCAVISGRSRRDVMSRLGDARWRYVVGNHGLEPGGNLPELEREVRRAGLILERAFSVLPGIELEDKRYSLALHYRNARNKRIARDLIRDAVLALPSKMRIVPGKLVVNLVPAGAPNKGNALVQLREAAQTDTALYVGDDVTDEDVFELDQPGQLLGLRIGESRSSAAAYFLRHQLEMDRLLARLVALREGGPNS